MVEIKRKRLGIDAWQTLLAQHEASGLSIADFCAREGVSPPSFYQWRTRLRAKGRARPGEVTKAAPTFMDLGALSGTPTERFELRLDLGGGLQLHLVRG